MKSYLDIKKEIDDLIGSRDRMGQEARRKAGRHVKFLRPIMLYLEVIENEDSVVSQLIHTMKRKDRLNEEFEAEHPRGATSEHKSQWMRDKGMTNINRQIKVCKYILGE